ncbi:uncharacterized protein LOC130694057 isoform X2 [Daphnia carinata]|uniref:uncharacterized protein LOC130694057 isoform X2 n=1 Tax=Daphnia carinata TaxID=120202 RepID=UPI00257FBE64|nr:uncharacterized protein LOC130694057 isoform X2 [Daphnia carinata]
MGHNLSGMIRSFLLILALSTCYLTAAPPDLQARVELLEKNYVEIKEHLDAKIIDLETKVGQLEAKIEKQDSLLAVLEKGHEPLKDNVAINRPRRQIATRRTCQEIMDTNTSYPSGMYWIDPDGQGIGDPPIRVHCDMQVAEANGDNWKWDPVKGTTSILHDSESKMDIGNCTEPGCYSRQIKYYASDSQIRALIQLSKNCALKLKYDCRNSPLNYNGTAYAWYNDKDGKRETFSGSPCDNLDDEKYYRLHSIYNRDQLPVTRLHFSNPLKGSFQYKVTPLRCHGKAKTEAKTETKTEAETEMKTEAETEAMPRSCEDLRQMGHTLNGIYSVRGDKQIETVFCQFDKRYVERGYQTWIGYVDVKSLPTYFNVNRFNSFNSTGVAIPFDVESVNVGNAMNLKTGIFTAPRDGTYFFSFNGLGVVDPTKERGYVILNLYLNAKQAGRTFQEEWDTTRSIFRPLIIQSTLKLKANDRVWLEILNGATSGYLYDDGFSYTRFTGNFA